MKLSKRTLAIVAAGAAAVVNLVGPSSAGASWFGYYAVSGNTTLLTPVLTVGGSGAYAFSSTASSPQGAPGACAGAVASTGGQAAAGLCVATAPTPGAALNTYVNIVCGTGTTGGGPAVASDTATIGSFTIGSWAANINYGIVFVAGVGVLGGLQHNGSVAAGGIVQITPTGGSCASAVTNFTANAVVVLTP